MTEKLTKIEIPHRPSDIIVIDAIRLTENILILIRIIVPPVVLIVGIFRLISARTVTADATMARKERIIIYGNTARENDQSEICYKNSLLYFIDATHGGPRLSAASNKF